MAMSDSEFTHDVFLSHSAKDKAVVCISSLSASNGERAGVRCRRPYMRERSRADGLRRSPDGCRPLVREIIL